MQLTGNGSSTGSQFNYQWTTNDGVLESGTNGLSPVISTPGTYVIEVVNSVNGCIAYDSVAITQTQDFPNADAGPTDELTCAIVTVELDGGNSDQGNSFTYQWSTTNGNIVSGGNTLNPMIDQPGTYQILVTNTDNGCSATAQVDITQDITSPTAEAGPTDELNCGITNLSLDGNGSSSGTEYTYTWNTQDGNITSGSNTLNPTIDDPGTYTIVVTNEDNGCTSTDEVIVTEDVVLPDVNAGAPDTLTCTILDLILQGDGSQGNNFTYEWTTSNGNIVSGETTFNPTVDQPGTYTLLITNTSNECEATSSVVVDEDVELPTANAGPTEELNCILVEYDLDGSQSSSGNIFTYEWTTGDGNILSGQNTVNPTIDEPGTYIIEVTNTYNGCISTAEVTITEDVTLPTSEAGTGDQLDCTKTTITLDGVGSSANGPFSYEWTTMDGGIMSGGNTLNPVVDEAGTYTLIVTNDDNGCTALDDVVVTQDANLPTADAGPDGHFKLQCIVIRIRWCKFFHRWQFGVYMVYHWR